jgi:WD40 repeat protein
MSLRANRGKAFGSVGSVMAPCLAAAAWLVLALPAGAEPPATPKPQMQLGEHTNSVNGVAVSPDGKTVVSGSQDKTIRFWDVASGKRVGIIRHTAGVQAVAFSPDGRVLAVADREGHIIFFDADNRKEIHTLNGEDAKAVVLAFSPDGETLASIGYHAEQVVLGTLPGASSAAC